MNESWSAGVPTLDGMMKGLPPGIPAIPIDAIGTKGWNLLREDLPLPAVIVKETALSRNEAWMRAFLARFGASMAPHGKTTMCPQLFRRQIEAGAWAITVATVHQLEVCRRFGIRRVVLANQLIGRAAIDYVLGELKRDPDFEFYCLVDSIRGVEMLERGIRRNTLGRPLNLLLEGGSMGVRTGCRSIEEALAVARAVNVRAPGLALVGVEGFEGLDPRKPADDVERFLRFLVAIAEACGRDALFAPGPVILSAGGSAFFDLVAKVFGDAKVGRETRVLTRSGCYIAHDSSMYRQAFERLFARSPELEALGEGPSHALEVLAYVQSRPEREKAILTMGKRDVSYDVEPPLPLWWFRPGENARPRALAAGYDVTALNDQHTHLRIPADSPLEVGDIVGFGVSHPCTTFDKWQLLLVVDEDYTVTGALRTFF